MLYLQVRIAESYPGLARVPYLEVLSNIFLGMTALTAFGCFLAAVIRGPYVAISGTCATLKSWASNRLLDEFTSAGLSERYLLDRLLAYYFRDWLAAAVPAVAFVCVLISLDSEISLYAVLIYFLGSAAFILLWLAFSAFQVAAGPKGGILFLACNGLLSLPWLGLLLYEIEQTQFGGHSWVFPLYLGFLVLLNRTLAGTMLERRGDLESLSNAIVRRFSLKRRGGSSGSDNAIVARDEMISHGWGELVWLGVSLLGLGGAIMLSLQERIPDIAICYLYFMAGFSGAKAMYRLGMCVSNEREKSTLETLTSTPMGVEHFHKGWLRVGVRPLVHYNLFCAAGTLVIVFIGLGSQALSIGTLVNLVVLMVLIPLLGGLVGLSIAAQNETSRNLGGQLAGGALLIFGLSSAQFLIVDAQGRSWELAVANIVGLLFYCLLLYQGSRRSLSRLFVPQ